MRKMGREKKFIRGRNHKRVFIQKTYVFLSGILVIFCFVYWITNHNSITIETILINGSVKTNSADIRAIATKHLSTPILYLIPRNNIFLLPSNKIEKDILDSYKIIKKISIKRIDIHTIQITVRERSPYAKWCGNTKENLLDTCVFLDGDGYLFSDNDNLWIQKPYYKFYGTPLAFQSTTTNLTIKTIASTTAMQSTTTPIDSQIYIGNIYMERDLFSTINTFIKILETGGIKSHSTYFEKGDGYLLLSDGGLLYFNTDKNLGAIAEDVLLAYKQKFNQESVSNPEDLDYIDTRFNNKVLFKFAD